MFCFSLKVANQAVIVVAILAVLASATTRAFSPIETVAQFDPAAHSPQEGILVLRGGQVLRGKITRAGDRYHVVMPHGEILIRAVEVESVCGTLDEAYRLKHSLLYGTNVHGRIALADWCLRNNLLGAAATELAEAMAVDPRHPMIAHLERRLQAALNPPTFPKKSNSPMRAMPSRGELERLSRAMPPGGMETFTATIQPLLLNSCSTHECHGPRAASKFRLLRTHPGRAPSRRLTQLNLYSVMQWIDSENPTASPLLTKTIEPHGPKRTVIFDETNVDQYRELVNWATRAVLDQKVQSLQRPATVEHKPGSWVKDVLAKHGGVRHASHNAKPSAAPRASSAPRGVRRAVFETSLPQEKDAKQKPDRPAQADPFDPAIFNRRYLPDE